MLQVLPHCRGREPEPNADGRVALAAGGPGQDRIDFFNSTLCPGTGEYRWKIEGDALRFSSLTEPCPGRAEALLNLRYGEYSPPP